MRTIHISPTRVIGCILPLSRLNMPSSSGNSSAKCSSPLWSFMADCWLSEGQQFRELPRALPVATGSGRITGLADSRLLMKPLVLTYLVDAVTLGPLYAHPHRALAIAVGLTTLAYALPYIRPCASLAAHGHRGHAAPRAGNDAARVDAGPGRIRCWGCCCWPAA